MNTKSKLELVNSLSGIIGIISGVITMGDFLLKFFKTSEMSFAFWASIIFFVAFLTSYIISILEIRYLKSRIENFLSFRVVKILRRKGKEYLIITGEDLPLLEYGLLMHIYEKENNTLYPVGIARVRYMYRDSRLAELEIIETFKPVSLAKNLIAKVSLGGSLWKPEWQKFLKMEGNLS